MRNLSSNQKSQIKKLKKNYNAKIRRLRANGVKAEVPKFDFNVSTVKELNTLKKGVNSFTNRSNLNYQFVIEEGRSLTKKEYDDFYRIQKAVNKALIKENNRFSGEKYRVISDEKQNIPSDYRTVKEDRRLKKQFQYNRKITSFGSNEDVEDYLIRMSIRLKSINSGEKDYLFKENMIEIISDTFGGDGDKIIEVIEKMSIHKILSLYYTTDIFNPQYVYSEEEYQIKLDYVRTVVGL